MTSLADGSNAKTIVTSDDYLDRPDWHPNGRDIAFAAVTDGNWSDGSNLRQITTQGFDMYPLWRPDGKALLFESNRNGNMDIWTADLTDTL